MSLLFSLYTVTNVHS